VDAHAKRFDEHPVPVQYSNKSSIPGMRYAWNMEANSVADYDGSNEERSKQRNKHHAKEQGEGGTATPSTKRNTRSERIEPTTQPSSPVSSSIGQQKRKSKTVATCEALNSQPQDGKPDHDAIMFLPESHSLALHLRRSSGPLSYGRDKQRGLAFGDSVFDSGNFFRASVHVPPSYAPTRGFRPSFCGPLDDGGSRSPSLLQSSR